MFLFGFNLADDNRLKIYNKKYIEIYLEPIPNVLFSFIDKLRQVVLFFSVHSIHSHARFRIKSMSDFESRIQILGVHLRYKIRLKIDLGGGIKVLNM